MTTNNVTYGFPRGIKIVGYFFEAAGRPAANSNVIIREKTALGVDKWNFTKPVGVEYTYGWDVNGYTTFSAGQRISVYIENLTGDKTQNPILTLFYVWND